jgi:hypothetical protein
VLVHVGSWRAGECDVNLEDVASSAQNLESADVVAVCAGKLRENKQ